MYCRLYHSEGWEQGSAVTDSLLTKDGNLDESSQVLSPVNALQCHIINQVKRTALEGTSSHILWSWLSHDVAKWQFCSTTQLPSSIAYNRCTENAYRHTQMSSTKQMTLSIIRAAIGPCPWPSDIVWQRSPSMPVIMNHQYSLDACGWYYTVPPLSSANFSKPAIGSAPGESTKMRGEQQLESEKLPGRSNVGGWMYVGPMLSTMKSCTDGITWKEMRHQPMDGDYVYELNKIALSGRRHRTTTSLCNRFSLVCHGSGIFTRWGLASS